MPFFNEDIIKQIDNYEVELPTNDWEILSQKLKQNRRKTLPLWWYAAAAGVALLVGFGFAFFYFETKTDPITQITADNNLKNQNKIDSASVQNEPSAETQIAQRTQQFSVVQRKIYTDNLIKNHKESELPVSSFSENDIEQENASNVNQHKKNEPTRQISIEEAEKLMKDRENQLTKNSEKSIEKSKNQYYASLLASTSPTNFKYREKASGRMFIPSISNKSAIMSTIRPETKHDLPLTFGFTFGIPLMKRLYINTGLNYTYIHSKTERFDNDNNELISKDNQELHYLGVPLMLSFRIIDKKIFQLYISGGGAAEKGLLETHNYKTFKEIDTENFAVPIVEENKYISGFQFSLNANLGASVTFFKGLCFYIEPGFAWYIPAVKYKQPTSCRTQNPFFVNITAGLRFNFEK